MQPLDAFVTAARPPVYKPIPWATFRNLRYAGMGPGEPGRHPPCPRLCCTPVPLLPPHLGPTPAGDYANKGEEVQIYHYKR